MANASSRVRGTAAYDRADEASSVSDGRRVCSTGRSALTLEHGTHFSRSAPSDVGRLANLTVGCCCQGRSIFDGTAIQGRELGKEIGFPALLLDSAAAVPSLRFPMCSSLHLLPSDLDLGVSPFDSIRPRALAHVLSGVRVNVMRAGRSSRR